MYWKKIRGWSPDDCVNYNLVLYLRMYAVEYIVMTTRAHTISSCNFIYGQNTHKAHVQAFKQRQTHTSHTQNLKVKKKNLADIQIDYSFFIVKPESTWKTKNRHLIQRSVEHCIKEHLPQQGRYQVCWVNCPQVQNHPFKVKV